VHDAVTESSFIQEFEAQPYVIRKIASATAHDRR
jgi:hypothetical protein